MFIVVERQSATVLDVAACFLCMPSRPQQFRAEAADRSATVPAIDGRPATASSAVTASGAACWRRSTVMDFGSMALPASPAAAFFEFDAASPRAPVPLTSQPTTSSMTRQRFKNWKNVDEAQEPA